MNRHKFKSRKEALDAVNFLTVEASGMQGCKSPDECDEARAYIRGVRIKLNALVRAHVPVKKTRRLS